MKIYSTADKEFLKYGKRKDAPYYEALKRASAELELPTGATMYRASEEAFETEEILNYYRREFGGLDVEIGYCRGENHVMNALEWHKSSEIGVALSDMIMLLGDIRDIKDGKYDSSNLEAFLVKEGESVELYATTLHFCPISAKAGATFANVVILPRGTNTPLETPSENKLLISKNKWLIIHPEFEAQVKLGRVVGITGENIVI